MKKPTLILCILLATFSSFIAAPPIITRSHAGFWGYKNVQEAYDNQNYMLTCNGWGLERCRFKILSPALAQQPGYETLSTEKLDAIDNTVTEKIVSESATGKFFYNEEYIVVYRYTKDDDSLVYTIYSISDAKAAGIY